MDAKVGREKNTMPLLVALRKETAPSDITLLLFISVCVCVFF
jgi:hypothetical protein